MNNFFSANIDYQKIVTRFGSPALIIDKATIRHQYNELSKALPGVTLHYALKPLPLKIMCETLNELGSSFDLASNGEVDLVKSCGIAADKCIHTHPIKRDSDIKHALEYGCRTFVFDNEVELEKFIPYQKEVNLLLRVSFPNPETKVDLSKKFGTLPENVMSLLRKAYNFGFNVRGLSFHVGSQVATSTRHVEAVRECGALIKQATAEGISLATLDIGGGFPVDYQNAQSTDIYGFCAPIREALAKLPSHLEIIAEPGRFLSAPVMQNICSVVGISHRFGKPWYYLDDGVYCSYSGQIFDHVVYPKYTPYNESTAEDAASVLAGPTCDSIDVIAEDQMLPELKVGDLIVGKMMGAYTISTATEFNFIPKTKIIEMDLDEECEFVINDTRDEENVLKLAS